MLYFVHFVGLRGCLSFDVVVGIFNLSENVIDSLLQFRNSRQVFAFASVLIRDIRHIDVENDRAGLYLLINTSEKLRDAVLSLGVVGSLSPAVNRSPLYRVVVDVAIL